MKRRVGLTTSPGAEAPKGWKLTCVRHLSDRRAPASALGSKATREARIRTAHPRIGGLVLALSDDPQSTTAWAVGAQGEELLAKRLDGLADQGVLTLHDPRIPGTRADIDHIAISGSGVYVIDAKRYKRRPACVWKGVWSGPASSGSSSAVVTAPSWSPASTSR
jgi:hypothetical protein